MNSSDQLTRREQRTAVLFEEITTNNHLELADEVFAPNFYWPQFDLAGSEGIREWVHALHTTFPDMDNRVQEQTAEGDVVVTRVRCIDTQDRPFRGLPPSDRRADLTAIGIDRFEGNYIVERSAHFDIADLMRQLGRTVLHIPEVDRP